nr:hypothetical protein [Tanacetum cinerariifolium]
MMNLLGDQEFLMAEMEALKLLTQLKCPRAPRATIKNREQIKSLIIQALFHKPILDSQIHASSGNDTGRGPFNGGNCLSCSSVGSENEFVYDPNPYSYDETPNFYQPPHHQYETNSYDDEDYTISITPDYSITDSLSMWDEHLSTISKAKSDEFIKSSVENLGSNLSESKDLSDIKSECDVPVCDNFTTFSNSLFDANGNFSSSDNESFSDEDVSKEIYSNPLFDEEIISIKIDPHHFNVESDLIESLLNQDSLIISSPKIDSLLREFSGELAHIDLISPGINEADFGPKEDIRRVERLLYDNSSPHPPKEPDSENYDVVIESLSPSYILIEDSDPLMEEIDLFLTPDNSMPPRIENDDYDSEGDILFFEELLSNDSPSLPENDSFNFDVPTSPRPPAKPPDDDEIEPDTGLLTTKVVGDIFEHYVLMPRLLPTQPTLCPPDDDLWRERSYLGSSISPFLSSLTSFEEDTKGGASLSSTMIDDDEGVSSLLGVVCAAKLMDTLGDLFLKYSSYIRPKKSSKSSFESVEVNYAGESSLLERFVSGSKQLCSEAIAVSSSNLTWMESIIFLVLRL